MNRFKTDQTTKKRTNNEIESTQHQLTSYFNRPVKEHDIKELHCLLLMAMISSNIPFSTINDPCMKAFFGRLCSNFPLPSADLLSSRILSEVYTTTLIEIDVKIRSMTDVTITMDGWEDNSGNSVYGFMIMKNDTEQILDIVDMSKRRPTAVVLKNEILQVLNRKLVDQSSVIAFVTDSPTTMVAVRRQIQEQVPNIIPIRCCLHHFNLVAKDIAKLRFPKNIIKKNSRLVTFFNSSHYWKSYMKDWMKTQVDIHLYLQPMCETRWYSLMLVCLGVENFERGFQYCLSHSRNNPNSPTIPVDISTIIEDRYHFADNSLFVKILKPVIDAIGRLEGRDASVGDVLAEFINAKQAISDLDIANQGQVFKNEVLQILSDRAKSYDEAIYIVGLYLIPRYCIISSFSRSFQLLQNIYFHTHCITILFIFNNLKGIER